MKEKNETKNQLIKELKKLRREINKYKTLDAQFKNNLKNLKKSEDRYKTIFRSASDVIIIVDHKGRLVDVNERVKKLTGYKRNELIGKNVSKLLGLTTKQGAQRIKKIFRKRMTGRSVPPYEIDVVKKNGEIVNVEVNSTSIKKKGKVVAGLAIVRDITEHKRSEKALQESEQRYKRIFDFSPEVVGIIDLEGKLLNVNRRIYDWLGYKPKEIIGKGFLELPFLPNESKTVAKEKLSQGIRGKDVHPYELNFITKTDKRHIGRILASPIKDEKGKLIALLVMAIDITEQKRARKALQESEERFRTICETAKDSIFLKDRKQKYIHVNKAMEKLFGLPASKLIGKTDHELFGKEAGAHIKEIDTRVLDGEIIEEEHTKPVKGFPLTFHVIKVPVRDSSGKIIGLCGIARDITERRKTEEALRENEEKYRAVIEQSADNIFLMDVETMRVLEANEALQELLGYTADEIKRLTVYNFVAHPKIDINNKVKKILKEKQAFFGERKYRRKDGTLVDVEVNANLIIHRGKRVLCVVSRTITERKQVEDALRESEKKYKTLTENINVGIYRNTTGPRGKFIEANPAIIKMFGYKDKKEFLAINVADLYQDPNDRKRFNEKMLRKGFVSNEELELKKKNGSPFIGSVSAVAVRDERGKVKFYDGIVEDITERKRAEKRLRESEMQIRTTIESMGDAIHVVDTDLKILLYNKALEELNKELGLETEVLGKNVFDVYPFLPKIVHDEYYKVVKTGEPLFTIETTEIRGEIFITETRKIPIFEKNRVVRILTVIRDITERRRAEEALVESEKKYKTLTENINVGIYRNTVGPRGKFIEGNPAIIKMFGYKDKEEFLAINVADLYQNSKDREKFNRKMLKKGFVKNEELRLKKKNGTPFIASVSAVAVKDEKENVRYYDGIIEDVTERKRAEEALLESEKKFRGLYESVRDGIAMVDMDGKVIECNQSYLDMLGYTFEEIKRLAYQEMTPLKWHRTEADIIKDQILKRGYSDEYEKEYIKKDGTKFPVAMKVWLVRNERGEPEGMWGIIRDITERKRYEQELAHMATHDVLTGLPNRMLFHDRLTMAITHAQRRRQMLVVILLDLDRFKDINDTLGHSVGDELLKSVGTRLSGILRRGDTIARMGGDEFMILLPDLIRIEDSTKIAQKILEAIRKPFIIDGRELHITTSIGITIYPNDGEDTDILMKNADIAMYQAKDKGRNNYHRYTKHLNTKKKPY